MSSETDTTAKSHPVFPEHDSAQIQGEPHFPSAQDNLSSVKASFSDSFDAVKEAYTARKGYFSSLFKLFKSEVTLSRAALIRASFATAAAFFFVFCAWLLLCVVAVLFIHNTGLALVYSALIVCAINLLLAFSAILVANMLSKEVGLRRTAHLLDSSLSAPDK